MFNTFINSLKLRNAYLVNEIIYSLTNLPIMGKLIFKKLEGNEILKKISFILSIVIEFLKPFIINFIYIFIMIYLLSNHNPNYFVHIYLFITLAGMSINTCLFDPSKDKYYAIFNLRMNVKEYVISHYIEEMIKIFIGSIPFIILLSELKIKQAIFLPLFVISIKTLYNCIQIYYSDKYNKIKNENKISSIEWVMIIIFLSIAYILPIFKISISVNQFMIIIYLIILTLPYSFYKLYKFKYYKKIYKKLLKKENIIFDINEYSNNSTIKMVQGQLTDIKVKTNKKGMAYLNEIFTIRHKKILSSSAKKSAILLIIIFIILITLQLYDSTIKRKAGEFILNYLPYFMFIMYILNKGENVTKAYFMNCDHGMLNYNFFKTPKNMIKLFRERTITSIKINLLPARCMAIGLDIVLLISGVTNNYIYYLIVPLYILTMSVFFSIHYLILYYLFQPYNIESEMVNSTYRIICSATYFIIYFMLDLKIPTLLFGPILIILCFIYALLGLQLVYKKSPKTFKIK